MEVPKTLSSKHRLQLEASAISKEVIQERGYWSATNPVELALLGFAQYQRRVPALVIPLSGIDGCTNGHRVRPDTPRLTSEGKPVKYDGIKGAGNLLDVPKRVREKVLDPECELWITEGIKKADALASHGAPSIALLGVWSWASKGKEPLKEWEKIPLDKRRVRVIYDSDGATNVQVRTAGFALCTFLRSKGAKATLHFVPTNATVK